MQNNLQVFKNDLFEVAVRLENGEWIFDAERVAKSLGITDKKNSKEYVRWNRVNDYLNSFARCGEIKKGDFIPEPAVYKLAFKASNEVAEKFQDWLAVEVLPSIRKHGAYMTPEKLEETLLNPDAMIKVLTALKEEREEKKKLQVANNQKDQIIGELKPRADYTDSILRNKGLVTITQISKDYGMSGTEMNSLLNELGVQYKQSRQWLLYSKYHGKGYTHSETISIKHKDGTPDVVMNTKWTQKGRLFLYELLKKEGYLPVIELSVSEVACTK